MSPIVEEYAREVTMAHIETSPNRAMAHSETSLEERKKSTKIVVPAATKEIFESKWKAELTACEDSNYQLGRFDIAEEEENLEIHATRFVPFEGSNNKDQHYMRHEKQSLICV